MRAPTDTTREATFRNTFFAVLGLLAIVSMWRNASEKGAFTLICSEQQQGRFQN